MFLLLGYNSEVQPLASVLEVQRSISSTKKKINRWNVYNKKALDCTLYKTKRQGNCSKLKKTQMEAEPDANSMFRACAQIVGPDESLGPAWGTMIPSFPYTKSILQLWWKKPV